MQGGGEYGSKGKWKSASARRGHQEEDLKEDIIRSNTLWAIGPANFMKHWGRIGVTWGHFGVTLKPLGGTWGALGAHWELVGTSLGVFWGLKVLFGGLWRDLGRALGA